MSRFAPRDRSRLPAPTSLPPKQPTQLQPGFRARAGTALRGATIGGGRHAHYFITKHQGSDVAKPSYDQPHRPRQLNFHRPELPVRKDRSVRRKEPLPNVFRVNPRNLYDPQRDRPPSTLPRDGSYRYTASNTSSQQPRRASGPIGRRTQWTPQQTRSLSPSFRLHRSPALHDYRGEMQRPDNYFQDLPEREQEQVPDRGRGSYPGGAHTERGRNYTEHRHRSRSLEVRGIYGGRNEKKLKRNRRGWDFPQTSSPDDMRHSYHDRYHQEQQEQHYYNQTLQQSFDFEHDKKYDRMWEELKTTLPQKIDFSGISIDSILSDASLDSKNYQQRIEQLEDQYLKRKKDLEENLSKLKQEMSLSQQQHRTYEDRLHERKQETLIRTIDQQLSQERAPLLDGSELAAAMLFFRCEHTLSEPVVSTRYRVIDVIKDRAERFAGTTRLLLNRKNEIKQLIVERRHKEKLVQVSDAEVAIATAERDHLQCVLHQLQKFQEVQELEAMEAEQQRIEKLREEMRIKEEQRIQWLETELQRYRKEQEHQKSCRPPTPKRQYDMQRQEVHQQQVMKYKGLQSELHKQDKNAPDHLSLDTSDAQSSVSSKPPRSPHTTARQRKLLDRVPASTEGIGMRVFSSASQSNGGDEVKDNTVQSYNSRGTAGGSIASLRDVEYESDDISSLSSGEADIVKRRAQDSPSKAKVVHSNEQDGEITAASSPFRRLNSGITNTSSKVERSSAEKGSLIFEPNSPQHYRSVKNAINKISSPQQGLNRKDSMGSHYYSSDNGANGYRPPSLKAFSNDESFDSSGLVVHDKKRFVTEEEESPEIRRRRTGSVKERRSFYERPVDKDRSRGVSGDCDSELQVALDAIRDNEDVVKVTNTVATNNEVIVEKAASPIKPPRLYKDKKKRTEMDMIRSYLLEDMQPIDSPHSITSPDETVHLVTETDCLFADTNNVETTMNEGQQNYEQNDDDEEQAPSLIEQRYWHYTTSQEAVPDHDISGGSDAVGDELKRVSTELITPLLSLSTDEFEVNPMKSQQNHQTQQPRVEHWPSMTNQEANNSSDPAAPSSLKSKKFGMKSVGKMFSWGNKKNSKKL